MQNEIEARFLNIDKDKIRQDLKRLEFENTHPERLMRRKAFHFSEDVKNKRERWARVRDEGHRITLTVKEVKVSNDIKGVFESEVIIHSFEEGVGLLKGLGLNETAYQETYREEWENQDKNTSIVIDTWPHLEPYIEIESDNESLVRDYAKQLGFDFEDALFGGVDIVYNRVHGIDRELICRVPRITFDMTLEEIIGK